MLFDDSSIPIPGGILRAALIEAAERLDAVAIGSQPPAAAPAGEVQGSPARVGGERLDRGVVIAHLAMQARRLAHEWGTTSKVAANVGNQEPALINPNTPMFGVGDHVELAAGLDPVVQLRGAAAAIQAAATAALGDATSPADARSLLRIAAARDLASTILVERQARLRSSGRSAALVQVAPGGRPIDDGPAQRLRPPGHEDDYIAQPVRAAS